MTIDLDWNTSGAGVGEAHVLQLEDEGDLAHGDIDLFECYDEDGYFIWRELSEPYAGAFPEYNSGDPEACPKVDNDDLPALRKE